MAGKNIAKFITIALLIFGLIAGQANQAKAEETTKNRLRACSPEAGTIGNAQDPEPEGLDYSPTSAGKDFIYEFDNPICLAVVLPPYAVIKSAIAAMNAVCGSGSAVPRPLPSPVQDSIDIAKASRRTVGNPACGSAVGTANASLLTFLASISIQYLNAKDAYNNTTLCGNGLESKWTGWNSTTMARDIPLRKKDVENKVNEWIENCNEDPNSTDCTKISRGLGCNDSEDPEGCKKYREWYYGGVEREDVSDDACPDVTRKYNPNIDKNKVTYEGQDYPAQKYYMRGTEPGNYSCERFNRRLNKSDPINNNSPLSNIRVEDYEHAYKCCMRKSQSTVCVERKLCKSGGYLATCPNNDLNQNIVIQHKFCHGGSRCTIGPASTRAEYEASYEDGGRMICVSSYNMCPYNFNIGGGSTTCDYFKDGKGSGGSFESIKPEDIASQNCNGKSEIRDSNCDINNKAGKCKNYCQYLNQCVIVAGNNYIYETEVSSPYFSRACLNFIGDSKNEYGYNTGVFAGAQKHFTAPIAQCVRETLENVFYNRAGHTKCGIIGEYPDKAGKCFTDGYVYKQGQNVQGNVSFFSNIQEKLKGAIKMALTISVMMQGLKILLTGAPIKQTELTMYVVKIGLVLFFATGTAWQSFFFDGVYNASATFSNIVMNIKTSSNPDYRDGCQFGNITFPDGSKSLVSEYPSGKQYLSVFDTFDCKIARYLGFGPSASVANIAKLIFAGFFTGPIGIYFSVLTMIFGFYMVIVAFRALHIFLTSAFAIVLMIYVSPIVITTALFKKYEGIFNKWLVQLIGFSLQPIILFAYMGFFITIFDTLVVGSASFKGSAPEKRIICDKICVDKEGNKLFTISKDDGLGGVLNDLESGIADPIVDDLINPAADAFGAPGVADGNAKKQCNLDAGQRISDPMSDSVACMMNLSNDKFGKIPVLEPLGIGLPMLKNFFSDNGRQKILTLTKAVLILYILGAFMDEIPSMASNLMGGSGLPAAPKGSAIDIAKKVAGVARALQKRGMGASGKGASSALSSAKRIAQSAGSKGKESNGPGGNSGTNDDG